MTQQNTPFRRLNERATGREMKSMKHADGDVTDSAADSPVAATAPVPNTNGAAADLVQRMRRARAAVAPLGEQMAGRQRSAVFELFVLGKLIEEPRHGYLLHQIISAAIGPLRTFNWNTLYPLIRQLEADGLIEPVAGEQTSSPTISAHLAALLDLPKQTQAQSQAQSQAHIQSQAPDGDEAAGARPSRVGRRKAYRITPTGYERFLALMREPDEYTADYPDLFNIKLINFGHVPPDWRADILRHYRTYLRLLRDYLRNAQAGVADGPDGPNIPDSERPYILRMLAHRRALAEADLAWAEAELAYVTSQPLPGVPDRAPDSR